MHWHSHPEAILACKRSSAAAVTNLQISALCKNLVHKSIQDEFATTTLKGAREIVVLPNTGTQVLVTTTASRLLLMQPHFRCFPRHKALATCETIYMRPCQPFYSTVGSFPDAQWHLPKRMVTAYTDLPLPTVFLCRQIFSRLFAI